MYIIRADSFGNIVFENANTLIFRKQTINFIWYVLFSNKNGSKMVIKYLITFWDFFLWPEWLIKRRSNNEYECHSTNFMVFMGSNNFCQTLYTQLLSRVEKRDYTHLKIMQFDKMCFSEIKKTHVKRQDDNGSQFLLWTTIVVHF